MIRPREYVRLFASTGGTAKSSNVTPLDDYIDNVLSGVCLHLNLANQNTTRAPKHNNMNLCRFESSVDLFSFLMKILLKY